MYGFWVTLLGLPFWIQWVTQNLLLLFIYLFLPFWQGWQLDILSGSIFPVPLDSVNGDLTLSGSLDQPSSSATLVSPPEGLREREAASSLGTEAFPYGFDAEEDPVHYLTVYCHHCPLLFCAFTPSPAPFPPALWSIGGIFSSTIYCSSSQAGQESLLPPRDWFFFICLSGLVCTHPASKQGQFTSQRNMVLFITSHFKSLIWLLNYSQHWTLICFADGKQHLPNSLYCLGYPQLTVKLFWCSSDHFHFTLSLRLRQVPWTSQAGGSWYPGGFLSWCYMGQFPDRLQRLSESAWVWNMRVCCPSPGSHLQDAVGPPYFSKKPSRGLYQCERDFTNAMPGVML